MMTQDTMQSIRENSAMGIGEEEVIGPPEQEKDDADTDSDCSGDKNNITHVKLQEKLTSMNGAADASKVLSMAYPSNCISRIIIKMGFLYKHAQSGQC